MLYQLILKLYEAGQILVCFVGLLQMICIHLFIYLFVL